MTIELVLQRAVPCVLPIDAVAAGVDTNTIAARWHNDCGGQAEHGGWWSRSGILTVSPRTGPPADFHRGTVAQAVHLAVSADDRLPPALSRWTALRVEQAALMGPWDPKEGRFPISDHARYGTLERDLYTLRHDTEHIYGIFAARVLAATTGPTPDTAPAPPSLFDQETTP